MTKARSLLKIYYLLLIAAVATQTVLTCVRLAQTVAYQDRLAYLEQTSIRISRQLEQKQAELNIQTSLLSFEPSLKKNYTPITAAIKLSTHDTIALR